MSSTSGVWTLCPEFRGCFAVGSQLDARTNGPGTRTKLRLIRVPKLNYDRRCDIAERGEDASLSIDAGLCGAVGPQRVKLRRAQPEQLFSGVPLLTDIARLDRHVANVPTSDISPVVA